MSDIDSLTTSLSFSNKFTTETYELFKEGQVKDIQQKFVIFPIPTIDPLEFCHMDQEDKKEAEDEHDNEDDAESS